MGNRLEDLFLQLGQPGRYQLLTVALLTYQYIFFIAYPTTFSFWLITPPGTCPSMSENGTIIEETPLNSTQNVSSQDHFVSFAMEWGYTCQNEYPVRILQTSFFLGNMIGGIIFGPIADRFGRRPVAFGTIISAGIFGAIIFFTTNIYIFGVLKVLQGIVLQGFNSASNCMKTELLHNKYRSKVVAIADAFGLSLPMFYLAGISPLLGHWRYVELALCIPILMSFWAIWFMPESLRWLLKTKKRKEALAFIDRCVKINKLTLPDNIEKEVDIIIAEMDDQSKQQTTYSMRDLFRKPRIAMYSSIFAASWFTWLIINYGLLLSISNLSGNVWINFVIVGAVDLVFRSSAFLSLRLVQTKTLSFIGLFGTGVLLISIVILRSIPGLEHAQIAVGFTVTTFAIIGRAFIGFFVVSTYLLLSEVFPTPIRASAYGVFAAAGRIGALSTPQVLSLRAYTWSEFPFTFMGTLGIITGSLQLLFPDTKNKPMPNTLEETLQLHQIKAATKDKTKVINGAK
ncbi:hypothetical protein CHUAL_004616 [Chamberlinius hualienensis]